jgi:hypothetical protein
MVERTGSFAVLPVERRALHQHRGQPAGRIGELIAEELRDSRGDASAFARYGRPSQWPKIQLDRPAR